MKNSDVRMLNMLRDDSRVSFTKISRRLKMPVTTIFTRFQNLNGCFNGFKSLVDFRRLGYFLNVLFIISFDRKVLDFLNDSVEINTLQICGVEKQIFANCIFKSFSDFKNFENEIFKLDLNMIISHHFLEPVSLENFRMKETLIKKK